MWGKKAIIVSDHMDHIVLGWSKAQIHGVTLCWVQDRKCAESPLIIANYIIASDIRKGLFMFPYDHTDPYDCQQS